MNLCHLTRACEAPTIFLPYYEEAQAAEAPTIDKPPGNRKRGRPRKDIDPLIVIHMLSNKADLVDVADFLGVHRDTLHSNYGPIIDEGRNLWREKWKEITKDWLNDFIKEKKLKEELRKKKRKDYRLKYYQKHLK